MTHLSHSHKNKEIFFILLQIVNNNYYKKKKRKEMKSNLKIN